MLLHLHSIKHPYAHVPLAGGFSFTSSHINVLMISLSGLIKKIFVVGLVIVLLVEFILLLEYTIHREGSFFMKVLLINGSPHTNGCTYTALNEVAQSLNQEGIETEIVHIGNKLIRGCIACRSCKTNGKCIFDDEVNIVAKKFAECDGLVVGSPVYYASANGTLISFLDRLFFSSNFDKTMKVGACVTSSRRGGASATFDELNKYFTISNMPIASSQYWNEVHGNNKEEVLQDKEGLQIMRTLGKNMAFLIKAIHYQKDNSGLPPKEDHQQTNFIR